ncbi:MAG: Stp1/IreP family PP2C-type Ser/Thr phosphatase [Nitrospirales bacterium]|nr:Stp1/IreP family PP2C-type Ser/Thr phosphatase [Nitrospirales bacterium]
MIWSGFGLTDVGKVRKMNQDAFAVRNDLQLWVVADGMGGHTGGEVASRIAIETITRYVATSAPFPEKTEDHLRPQESQLVQALECANQAIREETQHNPALQGMGTTVVAVHILHDLTGSYATVAHAGDSRLYLFREQILTLWTRDHTLMEEQLELKLITPEQVRTHPLRHVLTKGLGIEPQVIPSVTTYTLRPHDLLLLCSDGLTKMLLDEEIRVLLLKAHHSLPQLCETLIKTANRLGGEDNTTVVVIGKDNDRTVTMPS